MGASLSCTCPEDGRIEMLQSNLEQLETILHNKYATLDWDDFEDFAIRWARGLEDALMRGNFIRPSALRSPGGGGSGAASPRGAHVFQGLRCILVLLWW